MGRLLAFLVVVVLAVGILGYYLGWFHVATTDSGNTTNVNVTVDKDKIKQDKEKAQEKLEETGHELSKRPARPSTRPGRKSTTPQRRTNRHHNRRAICELSFEDGA